jgi:hypothetical protein
MEDTNVIDTTFRVDSPAAYARPALRRFVSGSSWETPLTWQTKVYTFQEDGRSWREKYEESEASRQQLKDIVTAIAQLYTEAMAKVQVRCPKCRRFTDRTGRCQHCATLEPVSEEPKLYICELRCEDILCPHHEAHEYVVTCEWYCGEHKCIPVAKEGTTGDTVKARERWLP